MVPILNPTCLNILQPHVTAPLLTAQPRHILPTSPPNPYDAALAVCNRSQLAYEGLLPHATANSTLRNHSAQSLSLAQQMMETVQLQKQFVDQVEKLLGEVSMRARIRLNASDSKKKLLGEAKSRIKSTESVLAPPRAETARVDFARSLSVPLSPPRASTPGRVALRNRYVGAEHRVIFGVPGRGY